MIRRLCVAVLAACALPFAAMAQPGPPQDRYIVVLNEGLDLPEDVAADVALRTGGRVGYVYGTALRGFSITMPRAALRGVMRNPRVAYVEEDRPVSIFAAPTIPTGIDRIFATGNSNIGIDSTDDYRVDADVAVIDTGIDLDHPDLNVAGGVNCLQSGGGGPPWSRAYECVAGGDDDHNHGTHVAGTIGALDNADGVVGVAPGARLWAVKVLDQSGSGYESQIVAGIDWVAANADTIEVANMSLGGAGYSQAEEEAIQAAVNAGVVFAVSAGNNDDDATNYSPAGLDVDGMITVSALADFDGAPGGDGSPTCRDDGDDTLADFSNYGLKVEIAAPGVCILSTLPGGGLGTYSGTSMASPHVAGAAALLASAANPADAADVVAIAGQIIGAGNGNWVDESGDGITEPLLDVADTTLFNPTLVAGSGEGGGDEGGGDDPNSPPVVSFSVDCTDLACEFDGSGSSDPDGTISSYAWDFGDGNAASGSTTNHTYDSAGDYTVTLTITDDEGAAHIDSQVVPVSDGGGEGIELSAAGYKVRGAQHADLEWSGTGSTNVDVYRNGSGHTTTGDDGFYTYSSNIKGGGSDTFRVCEAGTATCSPEVSVTY